VSRQPHFKAQPKGTMVVWLYGLFPDATGDFVKKPMQECTGQEIVQEWLYHLGVDEDQIIKMAREGVSCIPCMLPYITAFFMPRAAGDRPLIVPEGSTNFAFIGQFTETERDTVFTTEYSVRTAMESVYTLLGVDRGVPEVFGSAFDVRYLLDAGVKLKDGEKLSDMKLPLVLGLVERQALKVVSGTLLEELLKKYGAI
jgi:oleate hydratase